MGRALRSKERLERIVSVRLTPAEETAIREEAARRGMSMSNLMRASPHCVSVDPRRRF